MSLWLRLVGCCAASVNGGLLGGVPLVGPAPSSFAAAEVAWLCWLTLRHASNLPELRSLVVRIRMAARDFNV